MFKVIAQSQQKMALLVADNEKKSVFQVIKSIAFEFEQEKKAGWK